MGIRRRLFETVNGKLPSWASATIHYDGVVKVLDTELSGTARFAKKLGHPLPVWLADNATTLIERADVSTRVLDVVANDWIQPGAQVRIDGRYEVTVTDVSDNGTRLHLDQQLDFPFDAGTDVLLHSYPVQVSGTYVAPVTQFVLHSSYPIYRGDRIIFSRVHEVSVAAAVQTGTTPEGLRVYLLTLAESQNVTLEDEGYLYLRCYPAYESPVLLTPEQPFVMDRLGGVFYEDMDDIEVVDTVVLRDDASDPLTTLSTLVNTAVYRTAFPVDTLVFSRRREGSMKWDSSRKCPVYIPSALELAEFEYHLGVPWIAGQVGSWQLVFEADGDAQVFVKIGGSDVLASVTSAAPTNVSLPMTTNATDLVIKVRGAASRQVYLRSVTLASQMPVRTISHTTVAIVTGQWVWGSTGLLAKRALRLSDITARADLCGALSGGFLVA